MQKDIDNHKPIVQSVLDAARKSEVVPQYKIQDILERFNNLNDVTGKHGAKLSDLTDMLSEFEREVDALEDWELPLLSNLESKTFMKGDLPEVGNRLRVSIMILCYHIF